jgi:hypothetical protein
LEAASQIRSRLLKLKSQGHSHADVADALNKEGFHAAAGGPFTTPIISQLCRQFRNRGNATETCDATSSLWTLTSLAQHLGVKVETINTWRRRQWVQAVRINNRWMLWADQDELIRIRKLAEFKRRPLQKTPAELTTPKSKPNSPFA